MTAPTISAQFLRHVINCIELTGRAPDGLLARHGLARGQLDDPEGTIPLADFITLFEEAAELVRNPHFGLHVGRLAGSDSLGPLSFLFLSAPTLGEAFASFTRYLALMQQASRNAFRTGPRWATFEYSVIDPAPPARRQDAEYSIGAIFSMARQFTGGDLVLREVSFEHERVGDYARYRDYFGCDVFFEQGSNWLSFDPVYLDRAGTVLSAGLHPIVEEHLRRKAAGAGGAGGGLVERARAVVASTPPDQPLRIGEAAARLGLSVPTLHRRLAAEGTAWRALIHAQRMAMATRLLRDGHRSVSDIALGLGYAEAASFIRAFARHFGTTPHQYRLRGQDPCA